MTTPEEIWRRYDAIEHRLTASLSERMLDLGGVGPGMHVLDLATGRGEPAIPAAHRVGRAGSVLGVDHSGAMLQMARERAEREGVSRLELRVLDAESLEGVPRGRFDVTLARWGLMYLTAPVAALSAARRAMVPRGVLVAAVWADPERVPYFTLPRRVLERFVPVAPPDLDLPGTFYYADEGRLHRDLTAAGFSVTLTEEREVAVMEARTGEQLVAWARAFGLSRLLEDVSAETQRAWEAELIREAEALRKDGVIRLGGVTRVVVARADPDH